MHTTTNFLPGQVTVTWRAGRVVAVRLGRATRMLSSKRLLGRKLLRALDKGLRAAGLEVELGGVSGFDRKVLRACARIRPGDVRTYGELAREIGRPKAARAVGAALGRNPLPILIPCHRVVASAGRLCGFTGGLKWKEFLLSREGWTFTGKGKSRRLARRVDRCGDA